MKLRILLAAGAVLIAGCTSGDSIVEPGPGDTETSVEEDSDAEDSNTDEVATEDGATTIPPVEQAEGEVEQAEGEVEQAEGEPEEESLGTGVQAIEEPAEPPADFVLDASSENAAVFTELAVSGLVLSLDEQQCADESAATAIGSGADELGAVIGAIQTCATAVAIDDFSADLIVAGGAPLPATEAACVSSRLQSGDEYQPFWAALLEEEPFDFLLADREVQNRFLELYTECVSVGRAVAEQVSLDLSAGTTGCIDDLFADREFVRSSIESDLSGNAEDQARVNDQISTCLTPDERSALGLE